jgi:two-component system, OmpR family, response regulator
MTDKPCVLIVEDEPVARQLLSGLLRMAGYDVVVAESGEEALLTLTREWGRLDGLFTAVDLPGLVDGWMVADEFRSAHAGPVVVASASEPVQARRREGVCFVTRPTAPPKVVEALNAAMRGAGLGTSTRGATPRAVSEPARARTQAPGSAAPQDGVPRAVA